MLSILSENNVSNWVKKDDRMFDVTIGLYKHVILFIVFKCIMYLKFMSLK